MGVRSEKIFPSPTVKLFQYPESKVENARSKRAEYGLEALAARLGATACTVSGGVTLERTSEKMMMANRVDFCAVRNAIPSLRTSFIMGWVEQVRFKAVSPWL